MEGVADRVLSVESYLCFCCVSACVDCPESVGLYGSIEWCLCVVKGYLVSVV